MIRNAVVGAMALLIIATTKDASAQATLAGTSYVQTFDNLSLGLPPGWSVRTNATANLLGGAAAFTTNNTSWSSTAGQFANFASTISNYGTNFVGTNESSTVQNGCTNRCPGVRQTGSFGDPGAAFVVQFENTLGFANFQLTIDLNLLSVQARSNLWIIDYGLGNSPAGFTPVWTNADPGVFGTTTRTVSFGTALDNQAENVWIRIVTLEAAAGTGSRDTFGIDNFRLDFGTSGVVQPVPLKIQMLGTNTVLTWDDPAFELQSASQATGVFVTVPGAASPYTNPAVGPQYFFRLKAN